MQRNALIFDMHVLKKGLFTEPDKHCVSMVTAPQSPLFFLFSFRTQSVIMLRSSEQGRFLRAKKYICFVTILRSRDRRVRIVLRYGLDEFYFESW